VTSSATPAGNHAADDASPHVPHAARRDALADLLAAADRCATVDALSREAVEIATNHFHAVYALLRVQSPTGESEHAAHRGPTDPAFWTPAAAGALATTMATGEIAERRFRSRSGDLHLAVLAAPVSDGLGRPAGALAIVVELRDRHAIDLRCAELLAFGRVLSILTRPRPAPTTAASPGADLRCRVIGSVTQRRESLAIAITNQLRASLGCEQVALAAVHRNRVKVLAVSGMADVPIRSPGAIAIAQAMEECLDLGRVVDACSQRADGDVFPIHRRWSASVDGANVASIPLRRAVRGATAGPSSDALPIEAVLTLRHKPDRRFTPEQLAAVERLVAPLLVDLETARLATRHLATHARDAAVDLVAGVRHLRGMIRMAGVVAAVATPLWMALGTMPYTVRARAVIEPTEVRHLTAPFAGRIAAASCEEGQVVTAGQVLVQLHVSELEVERDRIRGAIAAGEVEADAARSADDHAKARILSARVDVDRAALAAVEDRIARAVIVAPCDGFVLRGKPRELVGSTLAAGETLVEFVPGDALQVTLDIPERSILHVGEGARAEFRPKARPDLSLEAGLTHVRPVAEVRDASNVYVAKAALSKVEPWMRTGVEGIARIDAGSKPVWWAMLHGLVDEVRLRLWL
jgi:hypothetical protein